MATLAAQVKRPVVHIQRVDGRRFVAVLVPTGGAYGREFCLTNEEGPMVELWDPKYEHGPVAPDSDIQGQFVSRYYLDTYLGLPGGYGHDTTGSLADGIDLCGHVPDWHLDAQAKRQSVSGLLAAVAV